MPARAFVPTSTTSGGEVPSFALALGRSPSDTEQTAALAFIATQQSKRRERDAQLSADDARRLSLTDFCHTLFGLNEFMYVD